MQIVNRGYGVFLVFFSILFTVKERKQENDVSQENAWAGYVDSLSFDARLTLTTRMATVCW